MLVSAARLQAIVPGTVLVGGTAASYYAGHRLSFDHDHVLADLQNDYDMVLDAVSAQGDWVTARAGYQRIILGSLGGIETGIRQLRRERPLETVVVNLSDGSELTVPTKEELLRIKAFLAVTRNQTRDYLDVAALAEMIGTERAAAVLSQIDEYYAEMNPVPHPVATQVCRQLADPRPADPHVTTELSAYKGLARRWHDWNETLRICRAVATEMVTGPPC